MMKLKKIITLLVSLLMIALHICSCEPNGYTGDDQAALTLIRYECPYTSSYFGFSERVETDAYGRVLFKYWSSHDLFFENGMMYIYAIIQKEDSENIWHYGSDSYALAPSWEAFTEDKLIELKGKNDWGQALNLDTANKVAIIKKYPDMTYSITHIKNMITPLCNDGEDFKYSVMSVDKAGQVLVLFRIFTRHEGQSEFHNVTSYVAIIQKDGSYSEKSIVQLDDFYSHNEEIKMLKEAYGWESQGS